MPLNINFKAQRWAADKAAAFRRSREPYGLLSNMTPRFSITLAGLEFTGSEALYQALKFPEDPPFQRRVAALDAFSAKKLARSRPIRKGFDWNNNRVEAMAYTIAAKLAAHPLRMTQALQETGDLNIVESSSFDGFWGAKPQGAVFYGVNALGQLLTQLREALRRARFHSLPAIDAAEAFAHDARRLAPELRLNGQPLPLLAS